MFTMKIGVMPGKILDYTFSTPITVKEALEVAVNDFGNAQGNPVKAFLDGNKSYTAKLDNEVVGLDGVIEDDAGALIISRNIKGAR